MESNHTHKAESPYHRFHAILAFYAVSIALLQVTYNALYAIYIQDLMSAYE